MVSLSLDSVFIFSRACAGGERLFNRHEFHVHYASGYLALSSPCRLFICFDFSLGRSDKGGVYFFSGEMADEVDGFVNGHLVHYMSKSFSWSSSSAVCTRILSGSSLRVFADDSVVERL